MDYMCLLLASFVIAVLGFVFVIFSEVYGRRNNHEHVEVPAIFEDPNSLKQVPCPHIVDPASKYISLIIPAFNEEHRLPGALEETMKCRYALSNVLLLDSSCCQKGISPWRFKHSDPCCRISDIPVVVFGSRAHLEEKALATRKWYRNFLMKGFHLVVLLAAGPGIRDTQCGFKMFTRAAAWKLFSNVRLKRWCFDVELVFLFKWFWIPISEISVNWSEIPGSKVNLLSIPNMLWELVLMSVGYRTGIWRISNST
ncbi:Nucleotide-diphospho-sugar transferase [Sesbania bispinosa]|nr:Nucleotide-diphospho-sugar transferase [Sesbania bispinosa]